ncbi:TonB-dependent receptor [Shewanella sp. AS16]|uniref:TonB-dependent receptor plug domain-containing protein n=1 Tax=Shewanella sp. AS16 TaxID=2907625 RepID=UPI001F3C3F81|nr:TonB-dependent receptor [Shewanella sp. AS16]MCE9687991.1 TonB-dependent receptor [Shewanella sp. AS16]
MKKNRLRNLLPLAATLTLMAPAFGLRADEQEEMAALMALLEEETMLATQTKMNADYVPGMVSVLDARELAGYGVQTIGQALNQVAGFYITVNNAGDPLAIVRGTGASLGASNLKIMLNGVPVNRAIDGSADWLYRLPLSQFERIEVIRGPGSSLYGEFAFSGVINVISRSDNLLTAAAGSHDALGSNLLAQHRFGDDTQASLNFSVWDRDDSGLKGNPDNFANSGRGFSPGAIFDREQGTLALARLEHQGYQLELQYADVERGGWYGRNAAMPASIAPRQETFLAVNIDKSWQFTPELTLKTELSHTRSQLTEAAYLPIPAGGLRPGGQQVLVNQYRQDGNSESSDRANVSLHWTPTEDHKLYAALGYSHSRVDDAFGRFLQPGQAAIEFPADRTRVLEDSSRSLTSVTLQDQWMLTEALELTLGARLDSYSDWDANLSPRLAAVWRVDEHHILKAQYAEAFRPPTLEEAHPGPNSFPGTVFTQLSEERLNSSEVAYVYRRDGLSFHTTVFNTKIKDLIEFLQQPGRPPIWHNNGDISTTGVEFEWQQAVNRNWDWFANLSYVRARDHRDRDKILIGSAQWLARAGISWHGDNHLHHALLFNYVGEQEGADIELRSQVAHEFDPYFTLDYTLGVAQPLQIKGLDITVGLKNLTGEEYDTVPNPVQYPQGLHQGERTANLQLSYQF